jgi:drug/metabolite transporter (DMT)-like permease
LPLVALGASLWGLDTVLRRPLTGDLASSSIVFYEHALLSLVFVPYLLLNRRLLLGFGFAFWAAVLWIAWGGSAVGTIFYTQAVKLGNPTSAVFLQKLQPLFAVALARWWLREREPLRTSFWIRLGVALFAAYLISFGGFTTWSGLDRGDAAAALWAVGAAAIWGSCTVVGRYLMPVVSPNLLTALRVTVALPLLWVLTLVGGPSMGVGLPDAQHWGRLALMAFLPGFLGLLVYYRGLARTPASLATVGELCFPAAAAVLNWAFLGTEISTTQGLGVALLWFAVLWPRKLLSYSRVDT